MIDTDNYEGHTSDWKWVYIEEEREWQLYSLKSVFGNKIIHDTPDGKLAQDAPLLLAEVKRLYALISHVAHKLEYYFDEDDTFIKNLDLLKNMYYGDEEE
mgnify:CR=1 FL=1